MINQERYDIVSENELTQVLAHFNTEFIMGMVDTAINNRFNPISQPSMPNIVDAWNANFEHVKQYYGSTDMNERVDGVRTETYREIIKRICAYHSLNFTVDDVDPYSAAHYLYHFFVGNFLYFLERFYANYIITECDQLYDAVGLECLKKNKDASTTYAKKIFTNPKLAIINAHIDKVVTYMAGLDITMPQIFAKCGLTPNEVEYMTTLVSEQNGDFYRHHYVSSIMNDAVKPIRLNNIRFIIRSIASQMDGVMPSFIPVEVDNPNM